MIVGVGVVIGLMLMITATVIAGGTGGRLFDIFSPRNVAHTSPTTPAAFVTIRGSSRGVELYRFFLAARAAITTAVSIISVTTAVAFASTARPSSIPIFSTASTAAAVFRIVRIRALTWTIVTSAEARLPSGAGARAPATVGWAGAGGTDTRTILSPTSVIATTTTTAPSVVLVSTGTINASAAAVISSPAAVSVLSAAFIFLGASSILDCGVIAAAAGAADSGPTSATVAPTSRSATAAAFPLGIGVSVDSGEGNWTFALLFFLARVTFLPGPVLATRAIVVTTVPVGFRNLLLLPPCKGKKWQGIPLGAWEEQGRGGWKQGRKGERNEGREEGTGGLIVGLG